MKAWLLFGLSTLGMLIFAGLYFSTPKSPAVIPSEPNTATKEVVRVVPKEVERIVTVPAEIPVEYVTAMNLYQKMTNALDRVTSKEGLLFNMVDVTVMYDLNDAVKQVLTQDEVKAKFELALRRNNVPINADSANVVWLMISGIFDDATHTTLAYQVDCFTMERQWITRKGEWRFGVVNVYDNSSFGLVGKGKANSGLLDLVEKRAEMFANDFLSANPKPK